MPKQYSEPQIRWMKKQIDLGESANWIANHLDENIFGKDKNKCDYRTVINVLEKYRKQEQLLAAENTLIQNSLRDHHQGLIQGIEKILPYLGIPSAEAPASDERWLKTQQSDPLSSYSLLREHLDRKTLSKLTRWEDCYKAYQQSRLNLKEKLERVMKEVTGLKIYVDEMKPPYLYSESIYSLFNFILGGLVLTMKAEPDQKTKFVADLNKEIRSISVSGDVRLRGVIIVECPGQGKKYRKKILKAIGVILNSQEIKELTLTGRQLVDVSETLKESLREIQLLGLVPGRCRICRRLGLR